MTAPAPVTHVSETVTFLTALYAGQSGVLELRTFGPDGDDDAVKNTRREAHRLRDFVPVENGAFDAVRVHRFITGCVKAKLGAFFGVALRSRDSLKTRKGDAAHCQTLTSLFVDADFKHLGEQETRRRIDACPLPPSMVVESGGGLHPYWILKQPFQLKREMTTAKRWLRHIAASVADVVDEDVSEPIRVLRLPGSLNFKYDPPRPVTLSHHTNQVSTLNDIQTVAGEPAEPEKVETSGFKVPDTISKGDRHSTIYKFLRSQKARAVPLDVALAGCHALNKKQCDPPIPEKELDDYLRRVWNQDNEPGFGEHTSHTAGPEHVNDVPPEGEVVNRLILTSFDDIADELQPKHQFGLRLYRGSPTLLVGSGAVGKGFLLAHMAAQFTTGNPFPDSLPGEPRPGPARVATLLTEDSNKVFKSRLRAAGGNPSQVTDISVRETVNGMTIQSAVFFDDDMAELTRILTDGTFDLLLIETLVEHMGNRSGKRLPNTSNELEVRNQIRRLNGVCKAANIYCVAVMHPRKGSEGKAIDSPSGSKGFTNAARSVLFCHLDPDTEDSPAEDNPVRLLSSGKSNYSKHNPPTLRFKIESWLGDAPCGCSGNCHHQGRVDWFQGDDLYDLEKRTAQEVVEVEQSAEQEKHRHAPALEKAEQFLDKLIQSDGWIRIDAPTIVKMAREEGITKSTLEKAKRGMDLESIRGSGPQAGVVAWATPDAYAEHTGQLNGM